MGQTKMHGGDLANGLVEIKTQFIWGVVNNFFSFATYRDKADAEDHDVTDMHHHIGIHHKVSIEIYSEIAISQLC